jgi:hypothetical protein
MGDENGLLLSRSHRRAVDTRSAHTLVHWVGMSSCSTFWAAARARMVETRVRVWKRILEMMLMGLVFEVCGDCVGRRLSW